MHIRLSAADHNELLKRRANSTCRNLSEYVRKILLDRPVVATYRNLSQDDMLVHLAILNMEIHSIGVNLNQITKKLHTLRLQEKQSWTTEFSSHSTALLSKLEEIRLLIDKIVIQWLR